jgi:hypothetical protein
MRGVARGHWLVLRHLVTGAFPPDLPKTPRRWARTARPFVSVVVPARDEESTLPACLASIRAQERIAGGFEVIVVENGSRDETYAVALAIAREDPRIRVLPSDARNHAEAMNDGIMAARGDVIARVDAHSRIAPDYLRRVVAALARHPDAAAVGGPFLPAGETRAERAIGLARSSPFGVGGGYGSDRARDDHAVRSVQCGAYWREALVEAGLFDPAMAYGEDEELNWRVLERGSRIVPVRSPAAVSPACDPYALAPVLELRPGLRARRTEASWLPAPRHPCRACSPSPSCPACRAFRRISAGAALAIVLAAYVAPSSRPVSTRSAPGSARRGARAGRRRVHASLYGAGCSCTFRSALFAPEPPSDRADVAVEWPPG